MTLKEQISWCKTQIKQGNHPEVLRSILQRLQAIENKEPPHPFHNQAISLYKAFLAHYGLPAVVDGRQGKALREILVQLESVSIDKTPEKAFESFSVILKNWERTGDYLSRKKTLTAIRDNLLEIIDKIKNGATKKQSSVNEAEQLANRIAAKYQSST
jgi:hypothetical protein